MNLSTAKMVIVVTLAFLSFAVQAADIVGTANGETLNGTTGDDNISGLGGNDTLNGLGGNDRLEGGAGFDRLNGGEGDDILLGGAGFDILYGGAGNDLFVDENADGDVFFGGEGNDTASYAGAEVGVVADLINGTVFIEELDGSTISSGFFNIENLIGTDFRDTLIGGAGDNVLEGGGGDDIIHGGLDPSTGILNAGENNTASYAGAADAVQVDLNLLGARQNTGGAGMDVLVNIQSLLGSRLDDTLIGNNENNVLEGGEDNGFIFGFPFNMESGGDILDGRAGIDAASYAGAAGGVRVDLNLQGRRQDTGGAGVDTLLNIENLIGSDFDDTLIGDGANNILNGGLGNDILNGGLGNDVLDGGEGIDVASYAGASSAVQVDLAGGQSTGGAGNDTLLNIENLIGSGFNDVLIGDSVNNVLSGGLGNDILDGGLGDDIFRFSPGSGLDTVLFFEDGDLLDVTDLFGVEAGTEGDLFDLGLLSLSEFASFSLLSIFDETSGEFSAFAQLDGFFGSLIGTADNRFLLEVDNTPVTVTPLPAAAWLFGSGLLFLFGVGRRRKTLS